jgi:hypothetical protein
VALVAALQDDQPAIGPELDADAVSRGISADRVHEDSLTVRGHASVIPATEINGSFLPNTDKLITDLSTN